MTGLIVAMSGGKSALAQNAQLSASMRRMVGSGLLVAVGYIDPGNWATDIAGGSGFGYGLLSVVIASARCWPWASRCWCRGWRWPRARIWPP